MKVAIVGSEGFIGRELDRACAERGIDVVGIDAVPGSGRGAHVVADILDPDLARALPDGADAVIHLAALSRDGDCAEDPMRAVEVNVGGTLNVFRAARARTASQFVFASSEWVYGEVDGQRAQTEDMTIDIRRIGSEYALTKLMAEQMLRIASRRDPGTILTILRFGIVYGPRPTNWSAVEQLFDSVRRGGRVAVKGSLRTARRFIHVRDIAGGIIAAIERPQERTFNLTGDRLITLGDVIKASGALLGVDPAVIEGDPSAINVRDPDNARARAALRWRPEIDLVDGLRSLRSGEAVS